MTTPTPLPAHGSRPRRGLLAWPRSAAELEFGLLAADGIAFVGSSGAFVPDRARFALPPLVVGSLDPSDPLAALVAFLSYARGVSAMLPARDVTLAACSDLPGAAAALCLAAMADNLGPGREAEAAGLFLAGDVPRCHAGILAAADCHLGCAGALKAASMAAGEGIRRA